MKTKITVKFLFAAMQGIISLASIVLALLLKFDIFNIQSTLNISIATVGFYIVILAIFGFSFLVSAALLIYEWWEA